MPAKRADLPLVIIALKLQLFCRVVRHWRQAPVGPTQALRGWPLRGQAPSHSTLQQPWRPRRPMP